MVYLVMVGKRYVSEFGLSEDFCPLTTTVCQSMNDAISTMEWFNYSGSHIETRSDEWLEEQRAIAQQELSMFTNEPGLFDESGEYEANRGDQDFYVEVYGQGENMWVKNSMIASLEEGQYLYEFGTEPQFTDHHYAQLVVEVLAQDGIRGKIHERG